MLQQRVLRRPGQPLRRFQGCPNPGSVTSTVVDYAEVQNRAEHASAKRVAEAAWANTFDAVAAPRMFHPTLSWIRTMQVTLSRPMPKPITKEHAPAKAGWLCAERTSRPEAPMGRITPPSLKVGRRPKRLNRRQKRVAAKGQPTASAVRTNPATSAERPSTPYIKRQHRCEPDQTHAGQYCRGVAHGEQGTRPEFRIHDRFRRPAFPAKEK